MTEPATWFDAGVKFSCKGPECGDCCSGKRGPGAVWVSREEAARIAGFLGMPLDAFYRRYTRFIEGRHALVERANHDCVFFVEKKGCNVYDARPTQCRTYPFWAEIMSHPVVWEREAQHCPGIAEPEGEVDAATVRANLEEDARRRAIQKAEAQPR
jgi:hypothetical protein